LDADFAKMLDRLREQIDHGLAEYAPDQKPRSLYEPMRYALAGGGKRLRPLLLLLACETVGGEAEQGLAAALALELVHNFTLVHDDIMDHDDLRRGRETVYKKWEQNTAILAGDGLLVQAFSALARVEPALLPRALTAFTDGILEVCEGQAMDKEFESRSLVALDEYYTMIAKKTGRLFSLACEIGAVLGHGDADQIHRLSEYGALLGRAFQIQDDVLDIAAEEEMLGKDIGSDIRENKKSFLMVHLFQVAPSDLQQTMHRLSQQSELSPADIRLAKEVFLAAGSLQAAETEIARCLKKAEAVLHPLPQGDAKNRLVFLLTALSRRKF